MSSRERETELRLAIREPEELHELNLALADLRAAPDRADSVLKMVWARGWRSCWKLRDEQEMTTIPPGADG